MHEKILESLCNAKTWLTASEIALEHKLRSRSNVTVTLRQLQEKGLAVSRPAKDPVGNETEKWRHVAHVQPTPVKPVEPAKAAPAKPKKPGSALDEKLVALLIADLAKMQTAMDAIKVRLIQLGVSA